MDAKHQKIYDRYLQHLVISGLSKTTVKAYTKESKAFLEFVDELESITNSIVFDYLGKYSHLSLQTRNSHASYLRAFLRHLSKNVYPLMNKINIPYIRVGRKLPEILEQDELIRRLNVVKKLAKNSDNWIRKRDYALIILLYATGMRVSEALNFNMNDINDNNFVRIDNGKGLKDRVVPIAEEAIIALEGYIKACLFDLDKGFFLNYKGVLMSRIEIYHILKKSMGINPHSMRHHFATHMIINGADVSVVSELLGHSSLITTQMYTHIQKPQLIRTVKKCHPMSEEYEDAS